jgi:LacI family transcriptional regulator
MPTNIADVAERAGVSTATVSRVLSGKQHVSAAMRARVLSAVAELGYRPSRVARSLRAQRANIIGLIVSDIQNPFFTAIVRGVEDIAYERQYGVFLCNSDEDPAKEDFYIDLLLAEQVSGAIITPTVGGAPYYARLVDAGVPMAAIDRRLVDADVDTVRVDNVGAAAELVEGLIQQGHRRIGAVIGSPLATTGVERRLGYEQALQRHGIAPDVSLLRVGPPKQHFGYSAMTQLLDLPEPPTALFVGNNLLTIGVLRALHDRGLAPGKDMALAAFDVMDWMGVLDLPLLVAAQPTYAMGRMAAEMLFARMHDATQPVQDLVIPATIHREWAEPSSVPRTAVTRVPAHADRL